ncbi:hypothetical protein BST36_13985 [Mycolicibacterium moriokaense]|jgi:hypothetical protein|uniref:Uncharacterized protein n=1 Tax=Mycolicibacterium moriokaense TaxID=39691 RepID=A0AAD1M797_9MYCO|nr:hypothetical protein [Mycolicibacterium moriokaense]MCV7038697.1 hypothetical protein [Mycolicibacterium moriokaense]ORB22526.1 hypothetical protein BST36_13985 [Mycolicibacterium moriokaense]BBX02221.1 hypothetical protein MMOR_31570 [Mycolicibacterium moriokaense]
MTDQRERKRSSLDGLAISAVFLLVLGLTYSDDIVEFVYAGAGDLDAYPQWVTALVDVGLVLAAALLKWRMERLERPGAELRWREFAPILWRSWWPVAATLVVAVHIIQAMLGAGLWVDMVASGCFTVAMALLLIDSLAAGSGARNWREHSWIVPIVLGTLVVQVASSLWFPVINRQGECADTISRDFFAQMVQVIPMLLVTLGIELGYLQRGQAVRTPGQRAAAVLTVAMLCVAEMLTFSMLVTDRVACGLAATLHEYVAFMVSVQASAIALATLVWLLLSERETAPVQT